MGQRRTSLGWKQPTPPTPHPRPRPRPSLGACVAVWVLIYISSRTLGWCTQLAQSQCCPVLVSRVRGVRFFNSSCVPKQKRRAMTQNHGVRIAIGPLGRGPEARVHVSMYT